MSSSSSSINHSTAKKCKYSSHVNLLNLPDDLLWNCLARISRWDYPILSLVSKRFHFLVASEELFETRKLLGCTESFMCFLSNHKARWFILNEKPKPNPNPNNVMVAVRTRVDFPTDWKDVVAVGSKVYMIGGYNSYALTWASSSVFVLDRSHTWHDAPSMCVARRFPKVTVLDEKIYVVGGIEDYNSSNWIECFDPKFQKWQHVPTPNEDIPQKYIRNILAVQGNLYLIGEEKTVIYKPKEDKWDVITGLKLFGDCVIDNVLYRYDSGKLEWYDFEKRSWSVVQGLEKLPDYSGSVKIVNYDGKVVVLWAVYEYDSSTKKIRYAEISLEKRNGEEIYRKIDRCNVVLTVPDSFSVEKFVVVTF